MPKNDIDNIRSSKKMIVNNLTYMNSRFFDKVYILDFYINDKLETTYAFSVPPQSEDFAHTQRIGETKTFGGVILEDYGNDAVKITLSGTTINQEVKCIFTHDGSLKTYSGNQEIIELRKVIQKYGEAKNLDGKKIILTDLSGGSNWEVAINELQVKRSKDAPLNYTYTITFTGVSQTLQATVKNKKQSHIKKDIDYTSLQENLSKAQETVDSFNTLTMENFSDVMMEKYGISNRIAKITKKVKYANKILNEYIDFLIGAIDSTNINNFIDVYKAAKDLVEESYRLVFNTGAKLFNAVLDYWLDATETINYFKEQIENAATIFNPNNLVPGCLDQYAESLENFEDEFNVFLAEWGQINDECMVETKSICEYSSVVNPGAIGEDDTLVNVYGYQEITAKDCDTWESLAYDYLGTTDYAALLAVYNSNVTLSAGSSVFIPILDETKAVNTENLIYNKADVKDNYGVDIKIVNGDFYLQNKDLLPVDGIENLNQAIDNRLASEMDSRIRLSLYGIRKAIGKSNVALVFLKNSIEETVLADPRIEDVNDMTVYGYGDRVEVSFTYKDINKNEVNYGGTY